MAARRPPALPRAPTPLRAGLGRPRPGALPPTLALLSTVVAAACEIQQVTLAESAELAVAEVYLSSDVDGVHGIAWIHRTTGGGTAASEAPSADVFLHSEFRAATARFAPADPSVCAGEEFPVGFRGSCHSAGPLEPRHFGPGSLVEAVVRLPDGGRLTGRSRVPGRYDLVSPRIDRRRMCSIEVAQRLDVRWTRARGAWAYISETKIDNLPAALQDSIEVEQDPLLLVGLSISETDTTIMFPSEFGVFDRPDLGRDLALVLQQGLPFGTQAEVVVTAADRNYVNWVRRGVFNPSGIVRVPSLHGDGTGVFGSVVRQRFIVDAGLEIPAPRPCEPGRS